MDETDVYQFVDDEENVTPLKSSGYLKHRQYVRHSLAKDWTNFGDKYEDTKQKPRKEFKLRIKMKTKREIIEMNYKQFINHYRNGLKTYYTFLPLNQINELVRQMWIKLKTRQLSAQNSTNSIIKSKFRRRDQKKKRVSFRLDSDLNQSKDNILKPINRSLTKRTNKQIISRFAKPLDISYEWPQKHCDSDRQKSPKPTSLLKNIRPDLKSDSEELLEYSPQSRGLSIKRSNDSNNRYDDKSDQLNTDLKNNLKPKKVMKTLEPLKGLSPERGRDSDYGFDDNFVEPIVDLENSCPQIGSESEELLEKSPQTKGLSVKRDLQLKTIERKKSTKKDYNLFCSPVLNEINSTKSLKKFANNSWISVKKKTKNVLKNKSNERLSYSKRILFQSPDNKLNKQLIPTKRTLKVSIPKHLTEKLVLNTTRGDSLCDLFERDVSQNDDEININSETLMK